VSRRASRGPTRPRARLAAAAALALAISLVPSLPAAGQATAPQAQPALTTTASPPVTRRGQIRDTAVLSGAVDPTGTIAFSVYGPEDPTCGGRPAATSTRTVAANGTYVSDRYTAPVAGVYRFVARYSGDRANAGAATRCGDPGEAVTVSDPPLPILGKSFQVGPLSGRILVMLPPVRRLDLARAAATGFVPLAESRTLPVGSTIDATGGVARITTAADRPGTLQVGDFGAGRFRVLQNRRERGLTELDLVVGRAAATSCATRARRPLSRRVLAQLRSSVTGSFRTRGRFSAATVRGTSWDTVERCDGTLTRVHLGVVVVTDRRRARNVVVRAGRAYLARAP
jgi:hypothetical protein